MDLTTACRAGCGVETSRLLLVRNCAADAEKNRLKPWLKEQWCIGEVNSEFVAVMEDVLDLYAEPFDEKRPKVNFDETSKQLIAESRAPLPAKAGRLKRYDYE